MAGLFGEERRRMEIAANAFGGRAVLKLIFGALIRASESWPGIQVKRFETKQLEAIGAKLDAEHPRRHEPTKTQSGGASSSRNSSRNRT
jgi:hypothetical protein